jgi:putative acyl-CoA dehydrogenase
MAMAARSLTEPAGLLPSSLPRMTLLQMTSYGAELGSAEVLQMAALANRHEPELNTHDRFGNRIDRVDFHPAWHALLGMLRSEALHALPWLPEFDGKPGAHVARAAGYFLHAQVEAGSLCPTTMTFASIPVLRGEEALYRLLRDKLFSRQHDPRDLPLEQKHSMLVGMGMTEKQGGSDVRSNTTAARPLNGSGRGAAYTLTGHKWFFQRRCAMPTWCWRAPTTACRAFSCRAGALTATRTVC